MGLFLAVYMTMIGSAFAQWNFSTTYFKIRINSKGYITSMKDIAKGSKSRGREFSPASHSSPVMSLLKKYWVKSSPSGATVTKYKYVYPQKLRYDKRSHTFILTYPDGEAAVIAIMAKRKYIKLKLLSLRHYNNDQVEAIVWGPYKTRINNLFGEVIGVARDTSAAVNYDIGVLGLDSITTPGIPQVINDYGDEYIVHNPDPKRVTLPPGIREGQRFPLCGFGGYDVNFCYHPEEYFRVLDGTAALPDTTTKGITIMYYSKNATLPDTMYSSALPGYTGQPKRHWINGIENKGNTSFIGSSIGLYGSPDDSTLLSVLKPMIINEGMPYITDERGVWIRNPASARPDMFWYGDCDSVFSYAEQWGCHPGVQDEQIYHQLFYPNPNTDQLNLRVIPLSGGRKVSPAEFIRKYGRPNIFFGAHTLSLFLNNTFNHIDQTDVSPYASNSLAYCNTTVLARPITPEDTTLFVTDTTFWGVADMGSYGGPQDDRTNYFRIGMEILSTSYPISKNRSFAFIHVKRGRFRTFASNHPAGDTVYKLLRNCYGGLYPNVDLMIKNYADYYAMAVHKWGGYIDFDGGIGSMWNPPYESLMFLKRMYKKAKELGTPVIRSMSGGLSYEGWFFITAQNNGYLCDGNNLTWNNAYTPGHNGSEGKDLRNIYYANFYDVSTQGPSITDFKSIPHFEHFESFSVGWDATYALGMSMKKVESLGSKKKAAYFTIIRTWESARAANAFPKEIKLSMRNRNNHYHLEQKDANHWLLYVTDDKGNLKDKKGDYFTNRWITHPPLLLTRDKNYPLVP
jgi:hypothetical protein